MTGWTLIELMFATTLAALLAGISMPLLATGLDRSRTERRPGIWRRRGRANGSVKRSTSVSVRFGDPWSGCEFTDEFTEYDGNRNGVRTRDIERQVDRPLGRAERLGDSFPGVTIGLLPDLGMATEPVQLGASRRLHRSAAPYQGRCMCAGTESIQYAVRVLGATGRTRVPRYEPERVPAWIADVIDRRRSPRRVPDPSEPGSRMRLRTGRDLTVLEVSAVGAFVQGEPVAAGHACGGLRHHAGGPCPRPKPGRARVRGATLPRPRKLSRRARIRAPGRHLTRLSRSADLRAG